MPDLDFEVVEAEVLPYAAGPMLLFKLAIKNAVPDEQIHSVMLRVQIRIEATKRTYDAQTNARLRELFGDPEQFGSTVKSLHWTNVVQTVPPFKGSIVTDLPVVCTYDFDVVGAKYICALEDGDVPLLFLFSGTVLYSCEGSGLQIAQISWEKEAPYRMPIRFWKETMERYFPNSAWIRVRKDVFDRLYQYKGRNTLVTWENVFERLLQNEPEGERAT
ncbi:MAG: hypothetical protein JWL77_947 [Chthonomonadaceae bacterium]|nr:hypothetical protein [Chthonomonadaceae bacterium]